MRGIAWYFLSRHVKQEEWEEYKGKCVSCPAILESWEDGQCAHYISVSRCPGMALLRKNVALSCARCNNPYWSPDASIPFGHELDTRYGKGTATKLFEQSKKYNAPLSELQLTRFVTKLREQ